MKRILGAVGVAATLLLVHAVRAEVVTLADGSRLEGQAQVSNGQVTIKTREATLTLPVERVLRIEAGSLLTPPAAVAPAAPGAPAAPAAPAGAATRVAPPAPSASLPAARVVGPPSLPQAMAVRTDIAFDGVPPDEAFGFLRQITGMNLVLDNDVRRDTTPIYMRLNNVSVATALLLLADLNGYIYEERPGDILMVRMRSAGTGYVMRVYGVRDVLLSTEDTGGGLTGSSGGQSGSGGLGRTSSTNSNNRNQGLSPQFAAPGGAATVSGGAAIGTGGVAIIPSGGGAILTGAPTNQLFYRAQDLAMLMMETCGDAGGAQAPGRAPAPTATP